MDLLMAILRNIFFATVIVGASMFMMTWAVSSASKRKK